MASPRTDKMLRLFVLTDRLDAAEAGARRECTPKADLWLDMFAEELDIIRRVRNNIVYNFLISDTNLAVAVSIAERLAAAAVMADLMSPV